MGLSSWVSYDNACCIAVFIYLNVVTNISCVRLQPFASLPVCILIQLLNVGQYFSLHHSKELKYLTIFILKIIVVEFVGNHEQTLNGIPALSGDFPYLVTK